MSFRRGAEVLGASRNSIWRWRMAIIGALKPEPDDSLAGIVEANEAHQRESRKGSREWVRHRRDLVNHPVPPRLRWRAYRRRGGSAVAPPGGLRAWEKKLLAATDRAGHRAFEAIADAGPGGDLRRPAARDGARCSALHGRVRHLRADREGRAHPALRAQCRAADGTHPAQPPHQHRERPDQPFPRLHATLLRTRVKEPCSLRPMACRPKQRGPLLPSCAQAAARFRPSRQHGLLTPPR
jgi:hypothetical protein